MTHKPSSPSFEQKPQEDPSPDHDVARNDRDRAPRSGGRQHKTDTRDSAARSKARLEARRLATPRLEYPVELPISDHRDELVSLIRQRQVIVVCGETGSGKSTQLPKFCLEAGLGREGMIGHTQPRRLAARSIASRLAEELDTPLGQWVGYQVRFGDQTSDQTLVKLMTDGILLAETQSDRSLNAYDAIIIDEAHERSLNIDFLLGYLRQLLGRRPDLKLIITSATIDAERFAEHFNDEHGPAPIVNVEGRGYPVELHYLPWESVAKDADSDRPRNYDLVRHVLSGIEMAGRSGSGDTLVFLPTERDIREVSHQVGGHFQRLGLAARVDLLPLYARLPQSEQQKIFRPEGGKRRIIFATNVAESSLTVPGIRHVVDSGTARISRYSPRSKLQRLPVEAISRASANQRAGRCGRVGPGVCIRLYSLEDYEAREAYTTPEIRRTNLASVVLQTKTLRLGKLEDFPLLDPPRPEAIREGIRTLLELNAIDDRHELTEIGRKLGKMPVDPRVGRMILAADENGVLPEILPIAAALEIQDPRDRPPERRQAADESHASFSDPNSDFLSYLRLWRFYEEARRDHSRNKLTRVLRKRFLSPTRMREWSDVYRQLREMSATTLSDRKRNRKRIGNIRYEQDGEKLVDDDRYTAIHQSLLAGLLSGVAQLGDKNEYTGAGGLKLFLWPGSGIFSSKPKWIVAAELVETSKQFARTVARIDPRWIERVGAHLLKRSHLDPHWGGKAGGAFCYENLFLYGLPIVTRRRVPLAPIDPLTARNLLIEHGLAGEKLRTTARFVRYNRAMVQAIAELAAKTRRRDLIVDEFGIARFYQSRLPLDVVDRGRLEKCDRSLPVPDWAKSLPTAASLSQALEGDAVASTDNETSLYMSPHDLIDAQTDSITPEDFPDELTVGSSRLPLEYRFEPGSDHDGVRIKIHQAALSQVSDERLGWLVPGLLRLKLTAMIKSLPKRIRRNLVPAADVAAKVAAELEAEYGTAPFMPTVCKAFSRHAEMPISASDFQSEKLAQHLQFLVTVVDDQGDPLAEGRQLASLQRELAAKATTTSGTTGQLSDDAWSRSGMTSFEIDELPRESICNLGGVQVAQYPGLVDHGDSVATHLFPDSASAEIALRRGTTRLFSLAQRKELRNQVRWLPALEEAKIKLSGRVSAAEIESSLVDLLARIAFVEGQPLVRSREMFEARQQEGGRRIAEATQPLAEWLANFSESYFATRTALESFRHGGRFDLLVHDVTFQLDWLLFPEFLSLTPWPWLKHFPRYVAAISYRIDKAKSGAASRDQESMQIIGSLWHRWMSGLTEQEANPMSQSESEFRWMIEELRVSLFAQPLGTSVKVSPQRCEKLLK